MLALGVIRAAHNLGLEVTRDLSVVGFDDVEYATMLSPMLTTISQPIEEMGKLAVQMIMHHGDGSSYQKENVFDVELIRRQTTEKKGEQE